MRAEDQTELVGLDEPIHDVVHRNVPARPAHGEGVDALLRCASVNSSLLLLGRSIRRSLLLSSRFVCLFCTLAGLTKEPKIELNCYAHQRHTCILLLIELKDTYCSSN